MLANDPTRLKRLIADEMERHTASAELGRRSLKALAKMCWHIIEPSPFIDGYVVDAICEHLEAITYGQILRLLINIPPRHSKSSLLVIWCIWDWLHHPDARFLCASYSGQLSMRDNRRKRQLIESPWFKARYDIQLADDQQAKSHFENTQHGIMQSTATRASVTGFGGSRLVLDDPHSAADAHSAADRNAVLRWFREVWTNRLNDQNRDAMVTVMQRVHDDDVSGYILRERPDWVHLNLPALYEPTKHCTTTIWTDWRSEEGQLLWPERFSKKVLDGLRRDLGSQGFAAQYQQSPIPSGGGQFKQQWFRYYSQNERGYTLITPEGHTLANRDQCRIIITVDLAISLKQSADYTVIAAWAITEQKDLLLLDRVRDHLDNPSQQRQITVMYHRYAPEAIQIESTAYQLSIVQQLRMQGLPVREYKPVREKVARASTASVYYESGKVYHPQGVAWLPEWEDELLTFPMGSHDDQVDSVAMACEHIVKPSAGGVLMWSIDDETEESIINWQNNPFGYADRRGLW